MYGYEWTDEYGIFRLTVDAKIQKEIRPVFKEELDFFHMDEFWDYPDTDAPLLWAEGVRRYVMNSVCVAEAQGGGFYTRPTIVRNTEDRLQLQPIDTQRLYDVNANLMKSLEQRVVSFIRTQHNIYAPQQYAFVCAFSGGKDSIVLLDLCAKALAPDEFLVIFNNTGMELCDTYRAVEKAKVHWPELHFYEAKCHMDPTETWERFGPPASRLRWCCSVHKSVPTILLLKQLLGDKARAVVFDGVRAEESLRRSKYTEVAECVKNTQQINCHSILKWSSAEVFVYLLKNRLIINNAYRKGIYRVGCMLCPLSAKWQDSLIAFNYPNDIKPFLNVIEKITIRAKGRLDKKYIEEGGWKARTGGTILPQGENRVAETIGNDSLTFEIRNGKQEWKQILPVFGALVDSDERSETVKSRGGVFETQFRQDEQLQVISIKQFRKLDRFEIAALRGLANKTAYCVGCKACIPQCPTGAFQVIDGRIQIRYSKCIHCYNCISFTEKSCMVAKSLQVKVRSMRNPDQYKNFGLRQNFLEHFMNEGINCFNMKILGTGQYFALRHWLIEGGVMTPSEKKKLSITALGEKLIKFGPYNPLTWAILWANLAYNSVVCRSYCFNVEIGSQFDVHDIADTLEDSYSDTTRSNAASALANTLRESPIGSYLGQGLPISKSTYLRDGWNMPHGIALLYSLYLYAEKMCEQAQHEALSKEEENRKKEMEVAQKKHDAKKFGLSDEERQRIRESITMRDSFTLTELIMSRNNPEWLGVSPGDIFGLDNKRLRDCVQGLALTFPDYIRVSFVNDLDNIVLDSTHTSLSILDLAEE